MSWPQAEPLLWPQRHTGQAPLCPLKPLETRAIPGDLSSFDSRPPPGWETDPSLEEKSAPRGPCGGAPSRTEVQPAVKWEEGPCSLSSSSLDPQGRAFPGKGSKKQGPFHGCGSCRGRGGGADTGPSGRFGGECLSVRAATILGAFIMLTAALQARACWCPPPGSLPGRIRSERGPEQWPSSSSSTLTRTCPVTLISLEVAGTGLGHPLLEDPICHPATWASGRH